MKEQLVNLLITLASILITAAIAAIARWQQASKTASYKSNIDVLRDAVDAAVQSMQHSVEDLKDPNKEGKWDESSKAFVQKRVMDIASVVAKPAIDALMSKFDVSKSDINKIMMSFMEASVFANRMTKLEVFDTATQPVPPVVEKGDN